MISCVLGKKIGEGKYENKIYQVHEILVKKEPLLHFYAIVLKEKIDTAKNIERYSDVELSAMMNAVDIRNLSSFNKVNTNDIRKNKKEEVTKIIKEAISNDEIKIGWKEEKNEK